MAGTRADRSAAGDRSGGGGVNKGRLTLRELDAINEALALVLAGEIDGEGNTESEQAASAELKRLAAESAQRKIQTQIAKR